VLDVGYLESLLLVLMLLCLPFLYVIVYISFVWNALILFFFFNFVFKGFNLKVHGEIVLEMRPPAFSSIYFLETFDIHAGFPFPIPPSNQLFNQVLLDERNCPIDCKLLEKHFLEFVNINAELH